MLQSNLFVVFLFCHDFCSSCVLRYSICECVISLQYMLLLLLIDFIRTHMKGARDKQREVTNADCG